MADNNNNNGVSALGGLAGVAAAPFMTYANYKMGQWNADYQNKLYEENQKNAFQRSQALQMMATPLAVSGMKAAGLNPNSMTSPMQPGAVPQTPMGDMPQTKVTPLSEVAALQQSLASSEQSQAQTDLLKSQTEAQKIQNNREITKDKLAGDAYLHNLETFKQIANDVGLDDEFIERQIKDTESAMSDDRFNYGTFEANVKAIETASRSFSDFSQKLQDIFDWDVLYKQIKNRSADAKAEQIKLETSLMRQKFALDMAQRYYLLSETSLNKENLKNLAIAQEKMREEIKYLQSQGKLTEVQANKIYNSDVNTMLENGDVVGAARAFGVEATERAIEGAATGAGYAAVGALTGGRSVVGTAPQLAQTAAQKLAGTKGPSSLLKSAYGLIKDTASRKELARLERASPENAQKMFESWLKSGKGHTFKQFLLKK